MTRPRLARGSALGFFAAAGAAGEVEGDGEREHERREHRKLREEPVEFGGPEALLYGGRHGQNAPDDGDQADQQERLGGYLPLPDYGADGAQKLREDEDQEHPVQYLQRRAERPDLGDPQDAPDRGEEDHRDRRE